MIVIDASALLELMLGTPHGKQIAARLHAKEETLTAPHLLDLEIAQVLRRYCAAGQITSDRAQEVLRDLPNAPIERYPHAQLLERIWQLRQNFTAYDAAYIALAEALDATLLTRDSALTAPGTHRARVELI
jgi:predicted nucleic acid-binding protein